MTSGSADALVELAAHRLDSGRQVPARASQRSHLQVATSLATLQALAGAPGAELEDGGPIPDGTVQRLACDATITRVLLDAESAVIDVGRSQRVVPGATRRALNVRDRGCRWPGCDRSASWTAAHHFTPWANGRTDGSRNLVLSATYHSSVHEAGKQCSRADGEEARCAIPRTRARRDRRSHGRLLVDDQPRPQDKEGAPLHAMRGAPGRGAEAADSDPWEVARDGGLNLPPPSPGAAGRGEVRDACPAPPGTWRLEAHSFQRVRSE